MNTDIPDPLVLYKYLHVEMLPILAACHLEQARVVTAGDMQTAIYFVKKGHRESMSTQGSQEHLWSEASWECTRADMLAAQKLAVVGLSSAPCMRMPHFIEANTTHAHTGVINVKSPHQQRRCVGPGMVSMPLLRSKARGSS